MSFRIVVAILSSSLAVPMSVVGLSALQAGTAQPPATQGAARTNPDAAFMTQAAQDGHKEVELARLAERRASDDKVKAFAARMIADHGKANDELAALAKSKGVALPPTGERRTTNEAPAAAGTAGARGTSGAASPDDRLANLNGAEFDRAYMTLMVEDHEKAVQLFERETKGGQDAEVKAWAEKTLPTLREHLTEARSIRDRLAAAK